MYRKLENGWNSLSTNPDGRPRNLCLPSLPRIIPHFGIFCPSVFFALRAASCFASMADLWSVHFLTLMVLITFANFFGVVTPTSASWRLYQLNAAAYVALPDFVPIFSSSFLCADIQHVRQTFFCSVVCLPLRFPPRFTFPIFFSISSARASSASFVSQSSSRTDSTFVPTPSTRETISALLSSMC